MAKGKKGDRVATADERGDQIQRFADVNDRLEVVYISWSNPRLIAGLCHNRQIPAVVFESRDEKAPLAEEEHRALTLDEIDRGPGRPPLLRNEDRRLTLVVLQKEDTPRLLSILSEGEHGTGRILLDPQYL